MTTANPNSPTAARSPDDVPRPTAGQLAHDECRKHGLDHRAAASIVRGYSVGFGAGLEAAGLLHRPLLQAAARVTAGMAPRHPMGSEIRDAADMLEQVADAREGGFR